MPEILCLYCKAPNGEKNQICDVCGMPLSMSKPEEMFAHMQSAENSEQKNPSLNFLALDSNPKEAPQRIRIFAALAITFFIVIAGFLIQSHFTTVEQSRPQSSRIVLDQKVGATADDSSNARPDSDDSTYNSAEKAFNDKNYDEAERLLKNIDEKDKDYPKAKQLLESIERERNK